MKAAVIFNPTAGQGKLAVFMGRVKRSFHKHGLDCEILSTTCAGDGVTLARQAVTDGYELIVAAGGDGTVNEVANGIVHSNAKLGILPVGTVNVLARELRIPFNLHKAVDTIANGDTKRIDLGLVGDKYFTLMAGFGFDAEVVANVHLPTKDIIGASAYVIKGVETLAKYSATDITLEMPEEVYSSKAFLVIVANSSIYAYNLRIAPEASNDDGLLDVCIFEQPILDKLGFMHQLADVFVNRHLYHDTFKHFRTTRVRITSEPEIMVQIDGDSFSTTPVEISVVPQILPVMVPRV